MEQCLAYFRRAIADPQSVLPWAEWWRRHEDLIRQSFPREDYLRLKFHQLEAARAILARFDGAECFLLRDPQPELSDERRTAITRIIEEISHPASRLEAVADLRSAAELQYLLSIYNWDDGYAIPTAIAMHPKCDLAVALELFWLAWAVGWYLKEVAFTEFDDEAEFCCLITNGILNGQYRRGTTSYNLGLTASQLYRYRKQGVPEILLSNVHGTG